MIAIIYFLKSLFLLCISNVLNITNLNEILIKYETDAMLQSCHENEQLTKVIQMMTEKSIVL